MALPHTGVHLAVSIPPPHKIRILLIHTCATVGAVVPAGNAIITTLGAFVSNVIRINFEWLAPTTMRHFHGWGRMPE